jgi:ABC-type glycerol-3-phosphate transport system permease component
MKKHIKSFPTYAFLLVTCIVSLFPVYIMIVGSFKNAPDLAMNSFGLPSDWTINNYVRLLSYNSGIIMRTYMNSIFITAAHTLLVMIFGTMAAFAFSKYDFKGKKVLFTLLLATMMVPFELSVTPLYIMFSKIGWLNSYRIQIIPFTANVFAMYMIRQYMEGIPDSLIEAARIDGAGHFKVYYKIMIPICKPVIGATTVLVALSKFNDYLWPKVAVQKQMYQPIMTVLPTLNEKADVWNIPRELILTGCTIVIVPLIILFVFLQDLFMDSVAIGAVKE